MYLTAKFKQPITDPSLARAVELFFMVWVDDICNNKVTYTVSNNTICAEFDCIEDAVLVKLKGLPGDISSYFEGM